MIDSIRRTGVAIKGPITTPVGSGFRSVNVGLRQALELYANVRPARTHEGRRRRATTAVDLIIVRENTEDLYAGIEHRVGPDAAESIKIITRAASQRIARYAFEYAVRNGRRKVTAVHKANIMKLSDGLFLESCQQVAAEYEGRVAVRGPHRRQHVHAAGPEAGAVRRARAAEPVRRHRQRPGGRPGRRAGRGARAPTSATQAAVFEPVHGSAPKYAGQNKANPTALILSGALMLRHLGETEAADRVESAVRAVIAEGMHRHLRPGRQRRHPRVRRGRGAAGRRRMRPTATAGQWLESAKAEPRRRQPQIGLPSS